MIKSLFTLLFSILLIYSCTESNTSTEAENKTSHIQTDKEEQALAIAETTFENISPIDVTLDTNHVKSNTANFKVTLLLKNYFLDTTGDFGPWEKKDPEIPEFDFIEALRYSPKITHIGDHLYFGGTAQISKSNASVSNYNGYCHLNQDTIPALQFETFHEGGKFSMQIGELTVESGGITCNDTGINRAIIANENGKLEFDWLGNLKLFEFDLDVDGEKEIYIISYKTCQQNVAIYKVENNLKLKT